MIEVERRVLLNKQESAKLRKYFSSNAKFVKDFKRFTLVYLENDDFTPSLDNPMDLRVRTTKDVAKLTVKYGNWHSSAGRDEYEVEFNVDNIKELLGILKLMNYKYYSTTYIHRYQYKLDDFDITFDEYYFRDDGLMEVELLAKNNEEAKKADAKIQKFLKDHELIVLSGEGFIKFVQENNDIMELRMDFTKLSLDDWYEKWKDYIFCKI